MGCGASRFDRNDFTAVSDCVKEDGELKLSYSKVSYSSQQLNRLNEKFSRLVESSRATEALRERQALQVGVVVERLIQRLICNIGTLDPRFASKFLVSLQSPHYQVASNPKKLSFKYLVRLDRLSTPALYPECFEPPVKAMEGHGMDALPQGYVKVRVHGEYLEEWAEFINPNGLLRRDKIQERFIDLLARAAAKPIEPSCPANVDESRLCGSPGKIVDPITLHHILKLPASQQMFYGAAECNEGRFPDPRDFRIAIVEGTPEARLHISFLSPTAQTLIGDGDVEIVLTLGIGVTGWPLSSDYPSRYPLDHVDVILGYQAVQMDYYVVPKGPHPSIRCEDRSTLWEIRALPTEMFLEYHYSTTSAIGRIFRVLSLLLEILRSRGVKTINRYILKNLIFFELETKKKIEQWMPRSISRRVLCILDHLLFGLRNQSLPSYLFKRKNLLLQETSLEEDYVSDGDILDHYLRHLSQDGTWRENEDTCFVAIKDQLENVMLEKWTNVVTNLLPPISNRGRRLSVTTNSLVHVSYTRRQMEYVALLFREILKLKRIQHRQIGRDLPANGEIREEESPDRINHTEDFIFLLQIMFNQARQRICAEMSSGQLPRNGSGDDNRKKFKFAQLLRGYDVSTSMLIDDIRRNKKSHFYYRDDMNLVAKVIECLYTATDSDSRVLGPVLRPYLNQLFKGSHENCWFLPEWKKKMEDLEFEAIGAFSSLVVAGDIDPMSGILDSANKGWNWAKNCIQLIQSIRSENSASVIIGEKIDSNESGLRMVFTPTPQDTIRYTVALPASFREGSDEETSETPPSTLKSTCRGRRRRGNCYATIRSFSGALQINPGSEKDPQKDSPGSRNFERQPPHVRLRESNPFSSASMESRRQGSHRGLGSIVQALISLQKLTVLQEISQYLPQDEKRRVLNDIKKLSREVQRITVSNYRRRNLSVHDCDVAEEKNEQFGRRGHAKAKWKSATLPLKMKLANMEGSLEKTEIYRSMNEFDQSGALTEVKKAEVDAEDATKWTKEDTLLGTCRLLRKHERQRLFGGKVCEVDRSSLPKNALNTPFYLKVTAFERARETVRSRRRHTMDFMQF